MTGASGLEGAIAHGGCHVAARDGAGDGALELDGVQVVEDYPESASKSRRLCDSALVNAEAILRTVESSLNKLSSLS